MSVEQSLLGKDTHYPTQYQPDILFPIARAPSRQLYHHILGISQGLDWWHVFELSWLNEQQIPQVAIGRLSIPATSTYLIESKSLKLYFNSLNFKTFSSQKDLIQTIENDLSNTATAPVQLQLIGANDLHIDQPSGTCIDQSHSITPSNAPDANLLKSFSNQNVHEQLYSNLLRSNCPVTGQPDWGTLFVRYEGTQICQNSLLSYILSYRQHNGFHEQCVEQIFADIWTHLQPKKLMVYAAYTRRGGLDINPCRVSTQEWLPTQPLRLARQ